MGRQRKSRARKLTPTRRSGTARKSLTVSSSPFPVGAKVEVKMNSEGFVGSWFGAIITDHAFERGRVARYKIEYTTLVKEDDDKPDSPETDEVSVDNVRPEAPRRLNITTGRENEEFEFYLHELVEGYHNEGWWYGIIYKLKNQETGKYSVSFPLSREVIDLTPEEIRQQLNYINGNWFPIKPKPQRFERYKVGDKVEAVNIVKKYSVSWFPATIEKVIGDENYLIKYENINNPPNGRISEIVDIAALRPVLERNQETGNKIELNSHVEFYHDGWTNGVVTRVMPRGDYAIEFGEGDNGVLSEQVKEKFLRVRFEWDGKKWSKFNNNTRKRGRSTGRSESPKKKQKNDISPSKEKTFCKNKSGSEKENKIKKTESVLVKSGSENSKSNSRVKRAVVKCLKSKLFNELDASPSRKRGRSTKKKQKNDISPSKEKTSYKNKSGSGKENIIKKAESVLVKSGSENSKNNSRVKRAVVKKFPKSKLFNELDSSPSVNMKTGMRNSDEDNSNSNPNPNPNKRTSAESTPICREDLVFDQANPNPNPNPNERILSREINGDITLPFEKMSPLWKPLEELGYFKKTPQKPHFKSLKRCGDEERDGKALGLVTTFANLTKSIPNLSLDSDLAILEAKLTVLNSLEKDGFKVDPLRTRLNSLIGTKKEISQRDSIKAEKESELAQRLEDYNHDWNNIVKVDAELAKVRNKSKKILDKEKRLEDKKKRVLKKSVVLDEGINNLKREIKELERENELAREKCLVLPLE